MKSNFKITYRHGNGDPTPISRIIEAESAEEAQRILGPCHSIRSISVQCHGVRKDGNPCQRFTSETYCCEAHDPRHYQKELSLNLDTGLIELARFKGSKHYGTTELSIVEFREAFENGAKIAHYPRTQMVDRLIALDWDVDAVTASYEMEAWEERIRSRAKHFRVTIEAVAEQPYNDNDLEIQVTHNGWQWWTTGLTLDEARVLRDALDDYIQTGRDQTRNIDGDEIAKEK